MIATGVIDVLDVAARVGMRMRTWVYPTGVGRTFFGARMHCDTRDFVQRRVYHFHIYEPNLTHYIQSRVRPGEVFVDVGANVGYITLLASSCVGPTGKVIAVEASPSTFALLQQNLALNVNDNIVALNAAATSGPCEVEMVIRDPRNIGANAISADGAASVGGVKIPGDALSSLVAADIGRVAFIKIDIEGSEPPVLEDILHSMDRFTSLTTIAAEVSAESASFIPRFMAAGFRVYALPNNYRIGYMMARAYLDRSGEGGFVYKRPVERHDPAFTDYIFER